MNYKNQREAKRNDQVVGLDRVGHPIGGKVLELNPVTGSVLVSPDSLHPTWVSAETCLHAEDAFAEAPAKQAEAPSGQESAADQKPPPEGSEKADEGTHQI